jgi:hypothetical protein
MINLPACDLGPISGNPQVEGMIQPADLPGIRTSTPQIVLAAGRLAQILRRCLEPRSRHWLRRSQRMFMHGIDGPGLCLGARLCLWIAGKGFVPLVRDPDVISIDLLSRE